MQAEETRVSLCAEDIKNLADLVAGLVDKAFKNEETCASNNDEGYGYAKGEEVVDECPVSLPGNFWLSFNYELRWITREWTETYHDPYCTRNFWEVDDESAEISNLMIIDEDADPTVVVAESDCRAIMEAVNKQFAPEPWHSGR